MKKLALVVSLAGAVALAGCGSSQPQSATTPISTPSSASPTLTPTPTPTPTVLTDQAAGKYFLDTICAANKLVVPFNAAFAEKPANFTTGHDTAAAYRDGLAAAAKALAAPPLAWPQSVKADVDAFVNALYADVSDVETIAQQTTLGGLVQAWNTQTAAKGGPEASAIRIKLGLPSDAKASCGM